MHLVCNKLKTRAPTLKAFAALQPYDALPDRPGPASATPLQLCYSPLRSARHEVAKKIPEMLQETKWLNGRDCHAMGQHQHSDSGCLLFHSTPPPPHSFHHGSISIPQPSWLHSIHCRHWGQHKKKVRNIKGCAAWRQSAAEVHLDRDPQIHSAQEKIQATLLWP